MIDRCIFLVAVLCLAYSNKLQAGDILDYDPDSIPKYMGKEIVIESFKQNRGLYIEPVSASLLTDRQIAAQNIVNIKEFTAFIPNFYMPDYGSKMTSPVYIRGIGSRINSPSVALYVDGVPYFDRASFDVNLNDVESIEVLRGPQGTIYGRNTMGGVINIFTKSPLFYQGTNVNATAGSHHIYKVGASHYGKLKENLGYSVSANYGYGGGYFENKFTDKNADPIDEAATRARLMWRATPRLIVDLTLAYEYSDQDGYPYRLYDVKSGTMEEVNYNSPSFYERKMSTNGLHVSYIGDDFRLSSQSAFQFFDGKQGLDQDFTPENIYYVDFYHRQQMYSEEINIKSLNENNRYKWQFGAFGFYQNFHQNNDTHYRTTDTHKLQHAYNPTYGFAVYHQSTVQDVLVKGLSLDAGVRYDWEQTSSKLYRNPKENDKDGVKYKKSFSQITPKFSLNYTFDQNGVTYFSVTRGYKTGGFNNTAEVESEHTFDPEYSWSYEVGGKSSFLNNLIHLDLSLFLIDWRDQQISQRKTSLSGMGQGQVLRNAGKSQSKGVEFTAQLNPVENVEMQLSYGYTDAKFKDYNNGDKEDKHIVYDGKYIPMVPKNTFSLSASYTFVLNESWLDKLILNAHYTGLGDIYWNDANTVKQSFYDLLNAKVSFHKKDLSLELWAKNITDKKYISYHFAMGKKDYVQRGKPFTCGANVNLSF